MKGLIFLLILMPAVGHAQDIPQGSNTISAKGVTYKKAVDKLLDLEYTIETTDKDFLLASLRSSKYPRLLVNIRVNDSVCVFKETYGGFKVYYASKGDAPAFRRYFADLDKIVRSLGGDVAYKKE